MMSPSNSHTSGVRGRGRPLLADVLRGGLFALLMLASCIASGKPEAVPVQTRFVGPSQPTPVSPQPTDTADPAAEPEQTVRLSGAVNETVAFKFILSAGEVAAVELELSAEDLVGEHARIGNNAFRMYRQWPIRIERFPNWYLRSGRSAEPCEAPDVLVPIDAPQHGQPFALAPGATLPIWVEIKIPPTAEPGTYNSAISVRDGDGRISRTPLKLVVLDIYLAPQDAIPIPACVQLSPVIAAFTQLDPGNLNAALEDKETVAVLHRTFAILHDHGLSPYTEDVRPHFSQKGDGGVQLDWSQYDAFCKPLIDGAAYDADARPAYAWPIPADLNQPDPAQFNGIRSAVFAAVLRDYLQAAAAHFQEQGWIEKAFVRFNFPGDANPSRQDIQIVRQLATVSHLVEPPLPFVSSLIPQPMAPFGWSEHLFEDLSSEVDVWATPARYQHRPTMQQIRTLGKRTWLLPDRPPFSGSLAVEATPIMTRSLPWQAFLQGHDAVVLPHTTDWPDDLLDSPIRDRSQPSDTWLLYPGRYFGLCEPLPSVRLKQLQLGIQDYQYLRLLERHGRGESARLLAGSLIKAAGTDAYGDNYQDGLFGRVADEAGAWRLAREILEEEVADAVSSEPGKNIDTQANQARWAKFLSATRGIRLWAESAKLRLVEEEDQLVSHVAIDVAIRSELQTPLTGKLNFGALLPDVRSISDILRVGPIPEMGLTRQQLIASVPGLPPCDLDGHFTQEIALDAGAAGNVSTFATVSVVQVPDITGPITIDGSLADWPPSEFNIAGDFRRITGRGDGVLEGQRAQCQTVAYLARNGGMLYIALHAAVPDAARRSETPSERYSNVVRYEDLMPLGEDLVEILFDPTNAATQSGDLFHIVLKADGNPVFERGVATTPPIGKCALWPGEPPRYCTARNEEGWSAEVAIPLSAFGLEAQEKRVWGFNITRLEPFRGEYSDWARAPRYVYDPRTLGNLVWPE